ncbi:MAG: serine/threonine protein kinase, partial [Planctomycetales bacterium]
MSQAATTPQQPTGPISIETFWQVFFQSQLLPPQQAQQYQQQFYQMKGAANATAASVAEWLIAQNCISPFQSKVLLSGQTGPFQFGDYRVFEREESGRLDGVFHSLHATTNHPASLVFLAGPNAQDPARVAEAAAVAKMLSAIRNDNLARVYHFADLQTYRFVAVERLEGKTLTDHLAQQGVLPAAEACRIARQIAMGVSALFQVGIVHGELRPENVWMTPMGTAKVMAFPFHRDPLAPVAPFDPNDPNSAVKADYLAPEISSGQAAPDARGDVYALGCLLYQCLTGRVPFPDQNVFQKVLRHGSEPVISPDQLNPSVPNAVAQLVMYLLAKDPNQRYQEPNHVAEALAPYVDPNALNADVEPHSAAAHTYDGWLAQNHPPVEPDPDTGEVKFGFHAEDFSHVQVDSPEAIGQFP